MPLHLPSPLVAAAFVSGGSLWFFIWLLLLMLSLALAVRAARALTHVLPEQGTAVASMQVLRCVMIALMVLYAMAYSLPRLAGVHDVMAGVGGEQVIHGEAIDGYFTLDSPASDLIGALAGLAESVYAIMLAMGIQADAGGPIELTRSFVGSLGAPLPDLLTYVYSLLLVLLNAVAPLSLAAVAVTQVWTILRRWQLVGMRRGHTSAYLMSGLGDAEIALAKSTFDRFADDRSGRPLIIFCNVSSSERDEHGDIIDVLSDKARGSAIFTHRGITEVLADLERPVHLLFWTLKSPFKQVFCFCLGDDYAVNVTNAIDVIGIITDRAAEVDELTGASPLDELELNDDEDGPRDADDSAQCALYARFERARTDARRYHVYCMHANQENELVFDSLAHGSTDDSVADALSRPLCLVRLGVEVRLISRAREQAYDLLTHHPLYDVLERPDYRTDTSAHFAEDFMADAPTQQLYVFVAGLGSYGLEVLKGAYWIGRMRGVETRIVGIDQMGTEIDDSLKVTCPEMMTERFADGSPVVRIVEAHAFTPAFDEVLRDVPRNARIYAVVTLGDDQLNLNVALAMRRTFDDMLRDRVLDHRSSTGRCQAEFPLIMPLINSSELFEAADRMTSDRAEAFRLEPFGKTEEVFSYHNIVDEPWERYALAMNAAYREVWEWREGRMRGKRGFDAQLGRADIAAEYAEYEIKKLSNRTNVRHIPYRLWCLGIDATEYLSSEGDLLGGGIDLAWWRLLMGYDVEGAELLMSHHKGIVVRDGEKVCDPVAMRREQDELRAAYPVVCALADLEHERWLAFYRSEGWRDLTIAECDRLVELGLIARRKVHQSPKLRLHCYLCSNEELLERGIALEDDPYTYDRAAVMETPRILKQDIFW